MLSIVIPVLNESEIIHNNWDYYEKLCRYASVIFVDGGSEDETVSLLSQLDATTVISYKGRSIQKNIGVMHTLRDYLLFLHVDSFIDIESLHIIEQEMAAGSVAGCLRMHLDNKSLTFRLCEFFVNFRAKYFGVSDGDLGLYITRDVFDEMGGFDELPIMEDILMGKKIRQKYKLQVLKKPIYVSTRKWQRDGFRKTFTQYVGAYWQLYSGKLQLKNV